MEGGPRRPPSMLPSGHKRSPGTCQLEETSMTHSVKAKIGSSVPLNALRAFEAAARHKSIKEAALELSVTPSAVGHRIRILESALGQELYLASSDWLATRTHRSRRGACADTNLRVRPNSRRSEQHPARQMNEGYSENQRSGSTR